MKEVPRTWSGSLVQMTERATERHSARRRCCLDIHWLVVFRTSLVGFYVYEIRNSETSPVPSSPRSHTQAKCPKIVLNGSDVVEMYVKVEILKCLPYVLAQKKYGSLNLSCLWHAVFAFFRNVCASLQSVVGSSEMTPAWLNFLSRSMEGREQRKIEVGYMNQRQWSLNRGPIDGWCTDASYIFYFQKDNIEC